MKVYSTAYKNLTSNMSTVKADVDVLTHSYDIGDYYTTALEASSLAKIALPVPSALDASA